MTHRPFQEFINDSTGFALANSGKNRIKVFKIFIYDLICMLCADIHRIGGQETTYMSTLPKYMENVTAPTDLND